MAVERFTTATAIAVAVEALFPQRLDEPNSAIDPVVSAAHALAHPSVIYSERLAGLPEGALYPRDLIMVSIAFARCLEAEGLTEQAVKVVGHARERLQDASGSTLRLCLIREYARLSTQQCRQHGPAAASAWHAGVSPCLVQRRLRHKRCRSSRGRQKPDERLSFTRPGPNRSGS